MTEKSNHKKIMVVEDDSSVSLALATKLGVLGYNVESVDSGEKAIEKANEFVPDLIVLDLLLPVKDGYAILRELRESEDFKETPVIVASNLDQPENIQRAMLMGATDYFVKSQSPLKEIVAKIVTLL
ncbi:response regulator [candidate division WWE3 bacterium]|uniref:Response regulator n=1 Tax=candidate division WWE3 bacterium TaxID=2053526 RepID=A0A955LJM1_UNCKA|nr:response regulator [candidate division WWE3 bacterium]